MNLKLKRLVRTQSSEQYALFDLNQVDEQGAPMTIGKLDLHYTGEGIYGTLLLWDDLSRTLQAGRRGAFIRALLDEVAQPMGVPNEYVIEFFAPGLDDYEVFHNVTIGDEDDYLGIGDDEDYDDDDYADDDYADDGDMDEGYGDGEDDDALEPADDAASWDEDERNA